MPIGFYSHTHTQSEPAAEWIVYHNLGTMAPVVDVYVDHEGKRQKIIPLGVELIDNLSLKVTFTVPRAGVAAVR